MTEEPEGGVVSSFDPDAAVDAAADVAGEDLLLAVAYDDERFEVLRVADVVRSFYENDAAMREHFADVHSYVHLDFTERNLFEDLFVGAGEVRAFATHMDHLVAVRVVAETEGLFLSLAPGGPTREVVAAVGDRIR
ncbi:hypothetical protein BRC94_09300 [Halobacteriales archaeon QS_5_70_17]|jgi:hypothetical protein|nr:MAG: hypothetical protein BRC94_09300 [Halobacteriales archaeon QS_5_70_17]